MKHPKGKVVEFSHDDRGLLISAPDGVMYLIPRDAVNDAGRAAIAKFMQSLSEIHSIDEVALDEVVVAGESSTLLIDALPTQIRRGQKLDQRYVIERLLSEGRRLLRASPEADELTNEEVLRDAIIDEKYQGMAANIVIAKRVMAALG
jgi:hypothetical protein